MHATHHVLIAISCTACTMDGDEDLVTAVGLFCLCSYNYIYIKLQEADRRRQPRRRRIWMSKLYSQRTRHSLDQSLIQLLPEPVSHFGNFCRMSFVDFEFLLQKISPLISKTNTNWREVAITLRFLASGDSFKSLQYLFKISNQVISKIVPEVCEAIIQVLKGEVQLPRTENEWLQISEGFQSTFPHCYGALDGKHVVIESPIDSGSDYFNYKKDFSIVLLALVDKNYLFLFTDIGCQGRMSDGGVLQNSILWRKIVNNTINMPKPNPLPGRTMNVPYVFVADSAFALSQHIMKPFPGNHNEHSMERHFNRNLSKARVIVENVFGIMTSVFRVFKKPMLVQPENASCFTMTCVLLHNFLRKSRTSSTIYTPHGSFDGIDNGQLRSGGWRNDTASHGLLSLTSVPRRSSTNAQMIRAEFAEYFRQIEN